MNRLLRTCLIALAAGMLLAACSPQAAPQPAVEPTATALPTTTQTPAPTAIPLPTATSLPTDTPPPTSTPSPTATPQPDFAAGKITSVEARGEHILWMLSVTGLTQPLQAQVNGNRYDCSLEPDYPDRLFCFGPAFDGDAQQVMVGFYPEGGTGPAIFEGVYTLPVVVPTALPAGDPSTWCPERGQDVFCETENRVDKYGNPCIVSSCFDACGYYYSIHTCPQPWSEYAP